MPESDLEHTGRPIKEARDNYGDTMEGNLLNKGSVTKRFTGSSQHGQPAPSLSCKAYVTVDGEHKLFRVSQWGLENVVLIPVA
jgi:hypothetical protein